MTILSFFANVPFPNPDFAVGTGKVRRGTPGKGQVFVKDSREYFFCSPHGSRLHDVPDIETQFGNLPNVCQIQNGVKDAKLVLWT